MINISRPARYGMTSKSPSCAATKYRYLKRGCSATIPSDIEAAQQTSVYYHPNEPPGTRENKTWWSRKKSICVVALQLRCCGAPVSAPHSSVFARLASEAFYETIVLATFYEIIKLG
jgi:hypothetical protein